MKSKGKGQPSVSPAHQWYFRTFSAYYLMAENPTLQGSGLSNCELDLVKLPEFDMRIARHVNFAESMYRFGETAAFNDRVKVIRGSYTFVAVVHFLPGIYKAGFMGGNSKFAAAMWISISLCFFGFSFQVGLQHSQVFGVLLAPTFCL
jgi:hypothetical protein